MVNPEHYDEIVVLTGAGVSVASGLETYRGEGGLWEASGINPAATKEGFEASPWSSWQFFLPMLERIVACKPNPAHLALAHWQEKHRGEFTLVTQNVDGLHTDAGSQGVLELHGNLKRRRCSNADCPTKPFEDIRIPETLPLCAACGEPMRPDIVLFGEAVDLEASHFSKRALRSVQLFVSIGTSGTVTPASNFLTSAQLAGATTVEMNLQGSGIFDLEIKGKAEETLPSWLDDRAAP